MLYRRILFGWIRRRCWLGFQCDRPICSVVKTKCGVATSRINESELKKKKMEKVMDCQIKSGRERRSHYPVPSDVKVSKELKKTRGG